MFLSTVVTLSSQIEPKRQRLVLLLIREAAGHHKSATDKKGGRVLQFDLLGGTSHETRTFAKNDIPNDRQIHGID
jgi:hypothetical protein